MISVAGTIADPIGVFSSLLTRDLSLLLRKRAQRIPTGVILDKAWHSGHVTQTFCLQQGSGKSFAFLIPGDRHS